MGVEVRWDNEEETIVRYEINGRWTWDDFYPEYDKAIEMEKSKPYRVDVILDLRRNATIPPSVLTHIKSITNRQPDNIGLSVLVTESRLVRILFDTAIRFYSKVGDYFVVVSTIEEAYATIEAARQQAADKYNDPNHK